MCYTSLESPNIRLLGDLSKRGVVSQKKKAAIPIQMEDPLWSSGHDTRLSNESTRVRIRGSANAFEPKRIRICDHEPSTPGESCGSSTR